MKAVVAGFNQEKALVGTFSVIVQLHRLIDLRHYFSSFSIPHLTSTFPIQSPQNLLAAKFDDIFHLEAERLHSASLVGPWLRCRFTKSPLSAVHHCTTQPPAWIQCKDGRKWSLQKDSYFQLVTYFRSFYLTLDLQKPVAKEKYSNTWYPGLPSPSTLQPVAKLLN